MSRWARLSVMGLYRLDNTIFDTFNLPTGIVKDTLVANILMECAELEIWLPNPDVFKDALGYWSAACLQVWTELYESTQFEYNPIWNKDATITETETRDITTTRDLKSTDDGTDTDKRSAYNATTFQNTEQTTTDHDYTDTGTVRNAGTVGRTVTEQGNLGVTTTQKMIEEQRNVVQFNIYDYILRSFKERFCVLVY